MLRYDIVNYCMRRKNPLIVLLTVALAIAVLGWGRTGHRIINGGAARHLPGEMQTFVQDSLFFADHASDADSRKGSDPTEGPKHYIDLENIPAYENLTRNLDSLIAVMGASTVSSNGILPWATADAYDSLVAQLGRGDMNSAYLTASDIGHYVGDGHNPLHLTNNYDGQLTGNRGIHSRYESTMIETYASQLWIEPDGVEYVGRVFDFVLAYCVAGNPYADSIIAADNAAKASSGWSGSGTPPAEYYTALWEYTRTFTMERFQRASTILASLWYSAWIDAGLLTTSSTESERQSVPPGIMLSQNYPNPFNPTTSIPFTIAEESIVRLTVYDLAGQEVAVVLDGSRSRGQWIETFDAAGLSSGVYIYQLQIWPLSTPAGPLTTQRRAMVLVR